MSPSREGATAMEGDAPQTPQFEIDADTPHLTVALCRDARLWGTLHSRQPQEVKDHLALKLAMLIGADIWG
ncbi:hypothetical protein JK191_02075 [Gluconobacter sphaericus]|uniref:hypothetical protein n=1 Tax=Gluconobacter sphaericus TaxID=574987 RepID=UPI001B8C0B6B|nr:hypothetical protein [Gluconobacter sphaericus]MBS1096378.1 hypothetical protein [Gluconobacter sphaericus]